jgi:hypothetical protein
VSPFSVLSVVGLRSFPVRQRGCLICSICHLAPCSNAGVRSLGRARLEGPASWAIRKRSNARSSASRSGNGHPTWSAHSPPFTTRSRSDCRLGVLVAFTRYRRLKRLRMSPKLNYTNGIAGCRVSFKESFHGRSCRPQR